jgi:hypothetical protein
LGTWGPLGFGGEGVHVFWWPFLVFGVGLGTLLRENQHSGLRIGVGVEVRQCKKAAVRFRSWQFVEDVNEPIARGLGVIPEFRDVLLIIGKVIDGSIVGGIDVGMGEFDEAQEDVCASVALMLGIEAVEFVPPDMAQDGAEASFLGGAIAGGADPVLQHAQAARSVGAEKSSEPKGFDVLVRGFRDALRQNFGERLGNGRWVPQDEGQRFGER